jgi:ATP-dependent exoDNAse (exonuclease V) alpha subunit
MFMSPFEYVRITNHPYFDKNAETHGHFAETPLRHPAYSAPAVPFRWMFRDLLEEHGEKHGLDIDPSREPELGFSTSWVQEKSNQLALLDFFFSHVKPEKSLCFFYAKEVPFVEDSRRVIIGVGRVKHVGEPTEYQYSRQGKLRSILWERMIQHSIRPGYGDGFLMPYYELIDYADSHAEFDPASLTAFVPSDHFDEFSYASELVSHDAAIGAIQACVGALSRANGILPGNYEPLIKWLHERLGELWKMRGPCPGLGVALCAFGFEHGIFLAQEIETKIKDNEDPWPFFEKAIEDPKSILSAESAREFSGIMRNKWKTLPEERKALLTLLSRFNIQPEQAKTIYVQEERSHFGIRCTDNDLIRNPYLIYEVTRLSEGPISLWTVDRGVFPENIIRKKHPLPEASSLESGVDERRVRAFTTHLLERAADDGHTLLRREDIVIGLRDMDIQPKCEVDADLMGIAEAYFNRVVEKTQLKDGSPAYQLTRLYEVAEAIRTNINNRRTGIRHRIDENWRVLLDKHLPNMVDADDREQEEKARQEKTAALKELAEARFSVLIGPAGTGKTTLLAVLCSQQAIAAGEILLLAPTGKARVRMEQAAKEKQLRLKGFTIAQFLGKCDRYDGTTGRYHLSSTPKESPAKTVIIDECSMLTEEMLAALLDALRGVERLIMIGDPRQLPPIGSGRPFVDIVSLIAPKNVHSIFPKIGPGYAELTTRRRQSGDERDDIDLAEWFSGSPLGPGEDAVFDKILYGDNSKRVSFKAWETPEQFQNQLSRAIVEELKLKNEEDYERFDASLGATFVNGHSYYNQKAAFAVENWQILSPVRKHSHGVSSINRWIHQRYRSKMVEFAQRERHRLIPKPMGSEQIVYGDKVINNTNHFRKKVYPEEGAAFYIANGEIGMVVGQFRTKNMHKTPWALKVAFSSQPGHAYDFSKNDFKDEADPYLELAYALTIHKAQGSEFEVVILALPNPCRLLSRELLYTALTRQRCRIVVLHQGSRSDLKKFSSDEFSETAKRLTNLFQAPSPIEYKGRFYEERLIHCTLRGDMVRSKSELTVADRLHSHGIDYVYEQALTLGGKTRWPDFTIEIAETGKKIYWEHCGMFYDPQYRKKWAEKERWYRENEILPYKEGGGPNGILIVTQDTMEGGISTREIEDIIQSIVIK